MHYIGEFFSPFLSHRAQMCVAPPQTSRKLACSEIYRISSSWRRWLVGFANATG
jgi:hypothetical protein